MSNRTCIRARIAKIRVHPRHMKNSRSGTCAGRKRVGEKERERKILGTQFYKILNRPARRRLTRPRVTWLLYRNLLLIKRKLLRYIYYYYYHYCCYYYYYYYYYSITTIAITTITTTTTTITTTIIAIYRYLYIYNCVVWSGTLWYNRLVLTPYWNWDKFNEK